MTLNFHLSRDNVRITFMAIAVAFLLVTFAGAKTASADTLFYDSFEDGTFDAWDGHGFKWSTVDSPGYAYDGDVRAQAEGSTAGTVIVAAVPTTGYENINLSFYYQLTGLEAGDFATVEYSADGGATYSDIPFSYSDGNGDDVTTWTLQTTTLGTNAEDNPDFRFLFRFIANASADQFKVDAVEITGDVISVIVDTDADGVLDEDDNCPLVPNPGQGDLDSDGTGDACDDDIDDDTVLNDTDNCPLDPNIAQVDTDGDGLGDACDDFTDSDDDGVEDTVDNCPVDPNPGQADSDGDGIGDVCDPVTDSDSDGVEDEFDLCADTVADDFSEWEEAKGRFAWDGSVWLSSGKGDQSFTPDIDYTYGCSGTQILDYLVSETGEDYEGHYKHGLSKGLLKEWHDTMAN